MATGSLGYQNYAPVLNADVADRILGGYTLRKSMDDENIRLPFETPELGWNLASKYQGSLARGAGVFGVYANQDFLRKAPGLEKALSKYQDIRVVSDPETSDFVVFTDPNYVDPESGQVVPIQRSIPVSNLGVESKDITTFVENQNALKTAASELGFNPNQPFVDLFNQVNDASKDLYSVVGRTYGWDKDVGSQVGIKTFTGDAGEANHARVIYKREGDKLVPISQPEVFTFNDPSRSGFAKTSILPLLEIAPIKAALAAYLGPMISSYLFGSEAATGAFDLAGAGTGVDAAAGLPGMYPSAPSITDISVPYQNDQGVTDLLGTSQTPAPIDVAKPIPAVEAQYPAVEVAPTYTPVPGSLQQALPEFGVATQATTPPYTAVPGSFDAAVQGGLLSTAGTASTISATDALRVADTISKLTQQQPQQQQQQDPGTIRPFGSVDYSGLLSLLASRPGTSGLLGTRFQPQPVNIYNLLG